MKEEILNDSAIIFLGNHPWIITSILVIAVLSLVGSILLKFRRGE